MKVFFRMNVPGDFAVHGGGWGGVPVLVSPFDKIAYVRAYEFIVGRLRRECFPVGIAKIPDGCF